NIPRKAFEEYIGSDAAQRNFVLKSLVACQMNDIAQFHIYSLSETYDYTIASNGFQNMGLYEKIENKGLSSIIPTESGIAYKTMSDFLPTCQYDPQQTAALQLPNTIQGAAFLQPNGEYRYILWARTQSDQSEQAQAQYNFPTSFAIESLLMRHWDYSQTSNITNIQSSSIWLSGDPQFIIPQKSGSNPPTSTVDQIRAPSPQVSPNPFQDQLFIHWEKPIGSSYQLRWYNSLGQIISQQTQRTNAPHQVISIPSGLSQGFYWLQIEDENGHLFSFALTKQ
ncbi:MAG: T9SS type A sorting domain-containing protein, partial [Bacteroidota bacterium]